VFLAANDGDSDESTRELQRRSNRLFEARGNALLDEQAVDDDFDGVVLALVDDREIVQREQLPIDSYTNVAVLREFFELFSKAPFRPRTMGARSMMRSSDLQISPCKMDWTICSLDWRVMGLPQLGQCGTPTVA